MVKRRRNSGKKNAANVALKKSKRKKAGGVPEGKRRRKTSLTQLVRQREALEAEIDQLEQMIYAYETEYLSHSLRGNVVRGYAALLTPQPMNAVDHVTVDDEDRIFTKGQQ